MEIEFMFGLDLESTLSFRLGGGCSNVVNTEMGIS